MVFLFSGCEVVKDLQEQAELAAKAPSSPGDVKNSQYLDKFDSNIITFSLIFTDE